MESLKRQRLEEQIRRLSESHDYPRAAEFALQTYGSDIRRVVTESVLDRQPQPKRTVTQPWVLRQQFQRIKAHLRELELEDSLLQSAMELAH